MIFFKRFRTNRKPDGGDARPASSAPSIITADVDIEGNLVSGGELQIDGNVHGDVRALAAVIDVNGVVHGGVVAEEVMVRGRVIGPIRGIHVHIFASAHVEGDVVSSTLSTENGAWIDGAIHRFDDPLAQPVHHHHEGYGGARPWPPAVPYRLAPDERYDAADEPPLRPALAGRKAAE